MAEYVSPSPSAALFAEILKEEPDWYTLGAFLDVPVQDLDSIVHNHRDATVLRRLIEVHKCLQSRNMCLTWEHIATCLRRMDNHRLADKIHSLYIRPSIPRPPFNLESHSSESSPASVSEKEVNTKHQSAASSKPLLKVKDDKINVISGEFETLRERFDLLIRRVKRAFQNSTISVQEVRGLIEEKCGRITLQSSDEKAQLDEMFKWLSDHCSFLQYRFLIYLVHNLLEENLVLLKEVSKFKEAVDSFTSSSEMSQFIELINEKQGIAANNERLVQLKVRDFWSKLTMQQFETVVNRLVDTDELSRIQVGEGCICVSWVIPDHIDSSKLVHEPRPSAEFAKIIGVIYLYIGEDVIYSIEGEGCETIEASMLQAIEVNNTQAIELLLVMGCRPEVATYKEGCAVTNIMNIKSADSSSRGGVEHVCILGHNEHVEAIVDPNREEFNLEEKINKQLHQQIGRLEQENEELLKKNASLHKQLIEEKESAEIATQTELSQEKNELLHQKNSMLEQKNKPVLKELYHQDKETIGKMKPDEIERQQNETMLDSLVIDSNVMETETSLVDIVQKMDSYSEQSPSIISPQLNTQSLVSSHPPLVDSVTEAERHSQQLVQSVEERLRQQAHFYEYKMKELETEILKHRIKLKDKPNTYGYQPSLVPVWCHPELPFLQYGLLPVYRTIEHFNDEEILTDPFYTSKGGYKVALCVYPNGNGSGKGAHVSVFINLMKGPNDDNLQFPFTGIFTVQVMNWRANNQHYEYSPIVFDDGIPVKCKERVITEKRADGWGKYEFMSHNELMSSSSKQYLDEDKMCFKISYEPLPPQTGSPIPSWCDIMYSNLATPSCTRTLYNYKVYKMNNSTWYSQPFYSSDNGYKLQLNVEANGDGSGKGTHLSLYVDLIKGENDDGLSWPFNGSITVQLLNWSSDNHHEEETIPHYIAPLEYREKVVGRDSAPGGMGYEQFISHTELLNCSNDSIKFINNDTLCFRIISVDIVD